MTLPAAHHLPLGSLRVLDFTIMLAGPFATMMLADYGADVIKVEAPQEGDPARQGGPFAPHDKGRTAGGFFLSINRNKKSITLNLKHPEAVDIAKKLATHSQVVVENFRPGVMERFGLGYPVLSRVNPSLVYTSISGFGQTGPYRDRPAFDLIAQAMGGPMSITGPKGGPPYKFGPGIGDVWPAAIAAFATMAAVHHAVATGEGQHVDVAMYDSMIALMERAVMMYSLAGVVSGPEGNAHPLYAPYDSFKTLDRKHVVIAAHWDKQWAALCRTMEMENLLDDPRFRTVPDRATNYSSLRPVIESWTLSKTQEEIVSCLLAADVPTAPVNTVEDLFKCPHVDSRGLLAPVEHPLGGTFTIAGPSARMSRTPAAVRSPAPRLGEHTDDVLMSLLGYDRHRIDELRSDNVI